MKLAPSCSLVMSNSLLMYVVVHISFLLKTSTLAPRKIENLKIYQIIRYILAIDGYSFFLCILIDMASRSNLRGHIQKSTIVCLYLISIAL
ncbi:MAG: hypothetical protein H6Q68_964 [Firmicutes bacterium]|nr:hypothetical protein [Bacillota bacterium]